MIYFINHYKGGLFHTLRITDLDLSPKVCRTPFESVPWRVLTYDFSHSQSWFSNLMQDIAQNKLLSYTHRPLILESWRRGLEACMCCLSSKCSRVRQSLGTWTTRKHVFWPVNTCLHSHLSREGQIQASKYTSTSLNRLKVPTQNIDASDHSHYLWDPITMFPLYGLPGVKAGIYSEWWPDTTDVGSCAKLKLPCMWCN